MAVEVRYQLGERHDQDLLTLTGNQAWLRSIEDARSLAVEFMDPGAADAAVELLCWAGLIHLTLGERKKVYYMGRGADGSLLWEEACWPALGSKAVELTSRARDRCRDGSPPDVAAAALDALFAEVVRRSERLASISRAAAKALPGYYEAVTQTAPTNVVGIAQFPPEDVGCACGPRVGTREVIETAEAMPGSTWLLSRLRSRSKV
jgi:hypothetical protein